MGVHKNINVDNFPKQGKMLNERIKVCFEYDTSKTLLGKVVRDDMEDPFRTIIRLEDGRFILDTECQYSVVTPTFRRNNK